MDIVAHALWTSAAAVAVRRQTRLPVSWRSAAVWGVVPDLVAFTIPAAVRIWRLASGASKSLLPDGTGPRFDWVWTVYNASHSLLMFAVWFVAVWLMLRTPVVEMFGWALHIGIDIFTHRGIFAIQFLWPLTSLHFDGLPWETGWLLAANYVALAAVYVLLRRQRRTGRNARGGDGIVAQRA